MTYPWPSSRPIRPLFAGLLGAILMFLSGCQFSGHESPPTAGLIVEGNGVANALNDYLLSINALTASPYEVTYRDLDNDRLDEALVLLQGPDWCGLSGCPLLIFRGTSNNDFVFLSRTERVRQPVLLSESRTNGWRDLVVGTTLKGQPEDVLLNYGLEGYPSDPKQGERIDRSHELQTQSAF